MSQFKFKEIESGKIHSIKAKTYLSATGYVKHKQKNNSLKFDLLSITNV